MYKIKKIRINRSNQEANERHYCRCAIFSKTHIHTHMEKLNLYLHHLQNAVLWKHKESKRPYYVGMKEGSNSMYANTFDIVD